MRLAPPPPSPGSASPSNVLTEQVRLQLQALLAEKTRLAAENARLCRENRDLHELLCAVAGGGGDEEETQ